MSADDSGSDMDVVDTTVAVVDPAAQQPRKRKRWDTPAASAAPSDAHAGAAVKRVKDEYGSSHAVTAVAHTASSPASAAGRDDDEDDERDYVEHARPSFAGIGYHAPAPAPASSSGEGIGSRLLRLAGYSGSGGLGRRNDGIVAPVTASSQIAKEGLGFAAPVKRRQHEYAEMKVDIEIKPQWLKTSIDEDRLLQLMPKLSNAVATAGASADAASGSQPPAGTDIDYAAMARDWRGEGPRDPSVFTSSRFCLLELQASLLAAKSAFDGVPSGAFRQARERSNPFELLKGEFFQNRAALKMAEIDAICNRMFTQPPSARRQPPQQPQLQQQQPHAAAAAASDGASAAPVRPAAPAAAPPAPAKRELIYAGDICAGPGGFSEFLLTVLKFRCVVLGMTLRGSGAIDFAVDKFNRSACTHSFMPSYGADGTGDITRNENMRHYQTHVMAVTQHRGLHVMMADGGFSVVGREQLQEYLSRQLVLCQFLTALMTLRKGGAFVCKLFDSFLPFTVDLLFVLRHAFTHFSIIKPNQSRPANSERYVVASGLKQMNHPIIGYLLDVNERINTLRRNVPSDMAMLVSTDFAANKNSRDRDNLIAMMHKQQQQLHMRQANGTATIAAGGTAGAAAADGVTTKQEPDQEHKHAFVHAATLLNGEATVPYQIKTEPGVDGQPQPPLEVESTWTTDSILPTVKQEEGVVPPAQQPQPQPAAANTSLDVLTLIPQQLIDSDKEFVEYVRAQNVAIAERQISTLQRLKAYVEDATLPTDDQESIRQKCLEYWGVSCEVFEAAPAIGADSKTPTDDDEKEEGEVAAGAEPVTIRRIVRRYVHFDPEWQCKHFNPHFGAHPMEPFTTTEASKAMVQDVIAGDIRLQTALVPLPDELERARLRGQAEKQPDQPLPPALLQLEHLIRHANSWYLFLIPAGGVRHTVWVSQRRFGHIDASGAPVEWQMQLHIPADTVLDVVWANDMMYVLDAYSLPSATDGDLHLYKTRPKLTDRLELVELLLRACDEQRIVYVEPIPLLQWQSHPDIREILQSQQVNRPPPVDVDMYLLRDGLRPPAHHSYHWSSSAAETANRHRHADEMPAVPSIEGLDELMRYVYTKHKQMMAASAAVQQHPR